MVGSMYFRHIVLCGVTKEALHSYDSHTRWDIACLIYHKGSKNPSQALKQHDDNE